MHYFKDCFIRILMRLNGYKTPKSVIDKLNKKEERQYKPQVYTKNRKSIYINLPFDGKKL